MEALKIYKLSTEVALGNKELLAAVLAPKAIAKSWNI